MSKRRRRRNVVDIVIPVYGRFDLLEKCLDSIPDTPDYKIIIVDNNSPDPVKDEFYDGIEREQEVRIIENYENEGFARACNKGARSGGAPLVFFLNSDVILEPDAIDHLIVEMNDSKVGICGMKLVFPEYAEGLPQQGRPPGKIQHIGIHMDIHGMPRHTFSGWSDTNPKVLNVREVWAVTGAGLMIRRSLLRDTGGFDEVYGIGTFEDIDLCMKVRDLGYNIIVSQDTKGVHYTNASVITYGVEFPLQMNQLTFMQRWATKLYWKEHEVL